MKRSAAHSAEPKKSKDAVCLWRGAIKKGSVVRSYRIWIVMVACLACVGCRSAAPPQDSTASRDAAAHTWTLELVSHQGHGPVKGRIGIDSRMSEQEVEQTMIDGVRAHLRRDDVRVDTDGIFFSTQLMSPGEETELREAPGTDALAGGHVSLHMRMITQRVFLGVTPDHKYFVLMGERRFLRDTQDEAIKFLVYLHMHKFPPFWTENEELGQPSAPAQ